MIRARAGAGVSWLDAGGKTGWCYPRGCVWRRHWGWDVDPASSGAALAMQRACILHGSFKYISSASNSMCCKSRRMVKLAMTNMCIIIERTSTEFPRSLGTCSVSGPCQARDFGILSLRFRMRMAIGDWPMCRSRSRCRCCTTEASRCAVGRKKRGGGERRSSKLPRVLSADLGKRPGEPAGSNTDSQHCPTHHWPVFSIQPNRVFTAL